MFVVRIIGDEKTDFKAFLRKQDAEERCERAWLQTREGEFRSTVLFEVAGTEDAREAVKAVQEGDKARLTLLRRIVPFETELGELDLDLDLDI